LAECHPSASIGFGVLFSKAGARIGPNVYVGPRCHLGLVTLGRDVLLAAGTPVTSGGRTHGTDDLPVPIREQEGTPTMVTIGAGVFCGTNTSGRPKSLTTSAGGGADSSGCCWKYACM